MKYLDALAAVLLVIGGLNWGLVAAADCDLVAMTFGDGTPLARVVYALVGLSAVYQIAAMLTQRRWAVAAR